MGKRNWLLVVVSVALASATPVSAWANQDKPKPYIQFSVAGEVFTSKQAVPITGDIDPATRPEPVTIDTQRFKAKRKRWVSFDKHVVESDAEGYFSFEHPPLPRGRYRARAIVGETEDHLAGKNRWKPYRVGRRNH